MTPAIVFLAFAHNQERQGHECDRRETEQRRTEDGRQDSAGDHEQQHAGENAERSQADDDPTRPSAPARLSLSVRPSRHAVD
jgi:hypothetical protein